jgi:hypothetical protein
MDLTKGEKDGGNGGLTGAQDRLFGPHIWTADLPQIWRMAQMKMEY